MFKYKLVIAYDGTDYGGWQVQENAPSIQATLQQALETILQTPLGLTGSGRTDAGVHALGQTAHFTAPHEIPLAKTFASVNRLLPPTIRVLSLEPAPTTFHARYSATSKIYHYHLHLDPIPNPFTHLYAYHPPHPVDLSLLRQGALAFLGTHDFKAFSHKSHTGAAAHDSVRTLYRLDIVPEEGGVRLEFEGDGFLYKMVRNITGTLLDLSKGKFSLNALPALLASQDRTQAGTTAPAHGLFLIQVNYQRRVRAASPP